MTKPKTPKKDEKPAPPETVPLFDLEDNRLIPTGQRVPAPKPKN